MYQLLKTPTCFMDLVTLISVESVVAHPENEFPTITKRTDWRVYWHIIGSWRHYLIILGTDKHNHRVTYSFNTRMWTPQRFAHIRVIREVCPKEEIEGKFHQNWD
jgi:hypothetical protein